MDEINLETIGFWASIAMLALTGAANIAAEVAERLEARALSTPDPEDDIRARAAVRWTLRVSDGLAWLARVLPVLGIGAAKAKGRARR